MVLEAMACGLPVIVTNQVGASDHVIDGENGFIVSAGSVKQLADKINIRRDKLNLQQGLKHTY